jgi:hypothetical protein
MKAALAYHSYYNDLVKKAVVLTSNRNNTENYISMRPKTVGSGIGPQAERCLEPPRM